MQKFNLDTTISAKTGFSIDLALPWAISQREDLYHSNNTSLGKYEETFQFGMLQYMKRNYDKYLDAVHDYNTYKYAEEVFMEEPFFKVSILGSVREHYVRSKGQEYCALLSECNDMFFLGKKDSDGFIRSENGYLVVVDCLEILQEDISPLEIQHK